MSRGTPPERPAPGYPATYRPIPRGRGIEQDDAFDPAMRQFPRAFRAGEPHFDDVDAGQRWRRARRQALDHVLAAIAGSPVADHVVLRGSLLLREWFGGAAREPGDIDLVVTPPTLAMDDADARQLFDTLVAGVLRTATVPGLSFRDDDVAVESIWTYERAPGRRVVFTWQASGAPPGVVQVDLVFNEPLPQDPVPTTLAAADGSGVTLYAASPELSLAWKLLWLETDVYPQGKDLYDAVLLAENSYLPLDLLRTVLARELGDEADAFTADRVSRWKVDWPNLRREFPGIGADVEAWKRRLQRALAPTFLLS